ncbi:MAG: hypothetical protein JO253_05470, partial [Alphaproteobacteria bacterium]|nr:hypothetical protein [Alphaproteobacteria bacterium]
SASWTVDTGTSTILYNGQCGTAAGQAAATPPTQNLCKVGVATTVLPNTSGGGYNWTCLGGTDPASSIASCQTAVGADAACGSANQSSVATVPTSNLCTAGTASAVNGANPWTWTCTGPSNNPVSCTTTALPYTCTRYRMMCTRSGPLHLVGRTTYYSAVDDTLGSASVVCTNASPGYDGPVAQGDVGYDTYTVCNCQNNCGPPACVVTSISNGTVNSDCSIACNSGYTLSSDGKSCNQSCATTSVTNGTVNSDCSIACNSGYQLAPDNSNKCVANPVCAGGPYCDGSCTAIFPQTAVGGSYSFNYPACSWFAYATYGCSISGYDTSTGTFTTVWRIMSAGLNGPYDPSGEVMRYGACGSSGRTVCRPGGPTTFCPTGQTDVVCSQSCSLHNGAVYPIADVAIGSCVPEASACSYASGGGGL